MTERDMNVQHRNSRIHITDEATSKKKQSFTLDVNYSEGLRQHDRH